jgi:O-antigen ligase
MNHAAAEIVRQRAETSGAASGVAAVWLERIVTFCLFLFAVSAPHSIAVAEGAWVLGMLAWAARFAFRPRPVLLRTPVDYALLGFFVLTFVSALCSYEPDISIGKLRAASLFTIVYLTAQNITSRRMLRALALTLVVSCMVNVAYTFAVYAKGRGVKVGAVGAQSPLAAAGVRAGDTLLGVDRARVESAADIERALATARTTREVTVRWPDGKAACESDERVACVRGVRTEVPLAIPVERGKFLEGATPEARLGIDRWSRGRDERAQGFYGHYTTYAEVLQLIGSLAFGLLVALRVARRGARTEDDAAALKGNDEGARDEDENARQKRGVRVRPEKLNGSVALLCVAVAGIGGALLLTVTRASWVAFLVSALVVVLAGAGSRRAFVVVVLAIVLLVPVGLYVLRAKRGVGFVDQRDESTTWRETVWREGARMLVSKPRHLLVGVGMDTLKLRWREWGMFDHGRLPWGHLHSTPLQIAFERGLPALAAWLALLFLYWRMLWRLARRADKDDWIARGLALGALGGAVGFFVSGLVHYNLGDSEVAMVFYFLMGLALALERLTTRGATRARRTATDEVAA